MNKPDPNVRQRTAQSRSKTDQRVLRTRQALGRALVQLMLERKFDDIKVQQILDRAKVGRATFYSHFSNKSDLLLSDADRYFKSLGQRFLESEGSSRRVAPVVELFSHVAAFVAFKGAVEDSGLDGDMSDLLVGHLAVMIERRIAVLRPGSGGGLSVHVISRTFASALVALLVWWVERSERPSAQEMDAQFHEIVWSGLARVS